MENVAISGCDIQFLDDKVVKSSSKEYSPRLLSQAKKQYQFSNFKIDNIFCPHIHSLAPKSFTMDKIVGKSWLSYLKYADISDLNTLENNLINYLTHFKNISTYYNFNIDILNKLDSLWKLSEYKLFIKYLKNKIRLNPKNVPKCFCHGDLTLSNIIFKDNQIHLIDFLDSFVNSYYIDIIKLRQDLYYHWCLKYNNIHSAKLERVFNKIGNSLYRNFKSEIDSEIFQILEAINILRIEPYIPREKIHIIKEMLLESNVYQEFNNTNLR